MRGDTLLCVKTFSPHARSRLRCLFVASCIALVGKLSSDQPYGPG